jgi:hypothetical protein
MHLTEWKGGGSGEGAWPAPSFTLQVTVMQGFLFLFYCLLIQQKIYWAFTLLFVEYLSLLAFPCGWGVVLI